MGVAAGPIRYGAVRSAKVRCEKDSRLIRVGVAAGPIRYGTVRSSTVRYEKDS